MEGYLPRDTFTVILTGVMNVLYHYRGAKIGEVVEKLDKGEAADPRGVARNLLDLVAEESPPSGFLRDWSDILRRAVDLPDGEPPELSATVREIVELSSREDAPQEERLEEAFEGACRLLGAEPTP